VYSQTDTYRNTAFLSFLILFFNFENLAKLITKKKKKKLVEFYSRKTTPPQLRVHSRCAVQANFCVPCARPLGSLVCLRLHCNNLRSVFFLGLRSDEVFLYASFNIGYSRLRFVGDGIFFIHSVFKRFCVAEKVTFYSEV